MGLDLVPFAMVRAVGATGAGMELEQTGGEAIVDVGAHVTNIVVHAAGETRFVRILPSGGRDITLAIARALSVDDEVAERLKRGEIVDEVDVTPQQALEVAMQRATQFVDEIRSSLEFYTAQTQGARIDRLLISGGGSKLEGFIDILRQRIPVTVEPGRVFSKVGSQLSLSEDAQTEAEPVLATAVGLADPLERLMSQVNLLPPEILAAQRQRRMAGVVVLAGIGVIGLIARLLLHPGERAERRSERHRGGGAEQRRVAAGHPGAPGVPGAPRAGPGQAGAPEPGLRQRDLLLRSPDGPLEGDPE